MRSIELELSTRSRMFGFGGLRSFCGARALPPQDARATSDDDAVRNLVSRILIVASSSFSLRRRAHGSRDQTSALHLLPPGPLRDVRPGQHLGHADRVPRYLTEGDGRLR